MNKGSQGRCGLENRFYIRVDSFARGLVVIVIVIIKCSVHNKLKGEKKSLHVKPADDSEFL